MFRLPFYWGKQHGHTPGHVPAEPKGSILRKAENMIDLILLAAGPACRFGEERLLGAAGGAPLYRRAFEAARQAADAMMGLRVLVVTAKEMLDAPIREFGFNKVVVPENRPLSASVAAGARAARSGASRCFLPCDHAGFNGELLTGFLQGYILSGRTLGRARCGVQEGQPTVFAPFLLPGLLALEGNADGSALFQGREKLTFYYDVPGEALREGPAGQEEASGEDH